MNKQSAPLLLAAIVLFVGILYFGRGDSKAPSNNPLNTSYEIEGAVVSLLDGQAEVEAAPGSATKITTQIFGEPVYGDLDGDSDEDAGLLIVQNPGGTGTFYYTTAAVNTNGNFKGTNAILLGDRIAPQSLEIQNGVILANYADRKPGEPFSTRPSIGITLYTRLEGVRLVEVNP